ASTRQLYLWVLERPEHIGDHAPVANEICESCHVTGEPEIWQRVAATAGHRTHLESDSTVLEGLMCVTCHGVEVHRFSPADSTCSQADCHADNDITLGEMENQTTLHCVTCHEFTADVPLLAERDSAQSTLTPAREECLGCHEMQEVLADFDAERDPHNGTCGSCHNPHAQTEAIGAAESCATSECHADWETEPFHVGRDHGEAGERCVLCHEPHRASIDASNCESCHLRILEEEDISPGVRRRLERSLPFDTTRVLRGVSSRIEPREMPPSFVGEPWSILQHWGAGFGLPKVSPYDDPLRDFPEPRASPPDTFPHDRHEDLSCLNCHVTRSGHGQLTFEAPRGCQICHHESPEREPCADCHQASELLTAQTVSVSVHTQSYAPREREVGFSHEAHTTEDCSSCHVESVSLAAGPEQASCNDCHGDHHQPARECSTCHLGDGFLEPHAPPADAHLECASCHVLGEDAVLRPDRQLCVTCHVDEREHYVEKECTVCHMGAPPEILQNGLLKRGDTP
ncbi:MAG: hypothetical protein OEY63_02285, partial [Gemmatimonadota bacterium]|nr:hypothetical protein [Gemmatimonadota bacterium]